MNCSCNIGNSRFIFERRGQKVKSHDMNQPFHAGNLYVNVEEDQHSRLEHGGMYWLSLSFLSLIIGIYLGK